MLTRRAFTRNVLLSLGTAPMLGGLSGCSLDATSPGRLEAGVAGDYDAALDATIPHGSSLRIVARTGEKVANSDYVWHVLPDGGGCFATPDGGWVYVSNSEISHTGGVGAIRFSAAGEIVDAYPILQGTSKNCAGGKTPWQTWLSCEENGDQGQVYECDPMGRQPGVVRPAMGSFNHEAAAVDPRSNQIYLTEDLDNGCLYRFTPATGHDLSAGALEVAVTTDMSVSWETIPDPTGGLGPLRDQVKGATRFHGGEGIVFGIKDGEGHVFFTTKKDNRVWSLNLDRMHLRVIYDATMHRIPVLTGVDNLEISPNGELLVAEDGGDMQIVTLDSDYRAVPLLMLHHQAGSEIAGPAYSPDASRLYFSSQKGPDGDRRGGVTYELTLRSQV
ncbi:MAG: DUF839 domain-containing protein [Proteobacteria bacterium]|jgi:hypothetical protein|nr:DUF839 domain-containing protein [Pseudomonadota bacterium]MDA1299015.1 DUF839 domain-containing protein [Pseudomonadota bacterium]